jgi:mRNA-decapping enzyme 1B
MNCGLVIRDDDNTNIKRKSSRRLNTGLVIFSTVRVSPSDWKMATVTINEQARKEANLRLLQRSMDRSIVDILGSATHVVLYDFDTVSNSWEKSNVEGSLFLCVKQNGRYTLVILNRNSPDNYPMDLDAGFQVQLNDPYLIFRNSDAAGTLTIRGVWFPNADERTQLFDLLQTVLQQIKSGPVTAPPSQPIDTASATAALLATLNVGGGAAAAQQQSTPTSLPPRSTSTGSRHSSGGSLRQASPTSSQQQQQPSLDKKSLQLALLSLIQDDRFLDLLHAQYLKVHHARTNKVQQGNGHGQQPR